MNRTLRLLLFCGPAALLAAWPAFSAAADDPATLCVNASGESAIGACTWVIQSGRWTGADLAWAYYNRGYEIHNQGQFARAIVDYDQAIALKPDYATAYDNRGNAYKGLGQYARAIQDFDRAIALKPGYATGFYNRGNAYKGLGQYARAIADYGSAIALKQDYANAYKWRCWARAVLGQQLDLALADCGKALELKPGDAEMLAARGLVYFRNGNFAAAIVEGNASLAASPNRAAPLYVRGLARLKSGDEAGGNADMAAAAALDPKIAGTYASYGVK